MVFMWKLSSLKFKIGIFAVLAILIVAFVISSLNKPVVGKEYTLEDSIEGGYDLDSQDRYFDALDKAEEILEEDGNPNNIMYFDLVNKGEYLDTINEGEKIKVLERDDEHDKFLISDDLTEIWVYISDLNGAIK